MEFFLVKGFIVNVVVCVDYSSGFGWVFLLWLGLKWDVFDSVSLCGIFVCGYCVFILFEFDWLQVLLFIGVCVEVFDVLLLCVGVWLSGGGYL